MTIIWFWNGLSDFQEKNKQVTWAKAERVLPGHVVSGHRAKAEAATMCHKQQQTAGSASISFCWAKFRWFNQNTFEHVPFSTNASDIKPCSEAARPHKRWFLGTLAWPLSNTGILPVRGSTDIESGFCTCGFCFTCIRKSVSLQKTHLNSILEREYQDKAGCISSRDLQVLQHLLLVPRSPSCTDTAPTF